MEATAVTIDNHPMWVNLEPAYPELEGYPEAELDRKVLTVIACYANSQGTAFPLQATIADILGEIKMNVNRSVHRLIDKRLIKILRKEKKYNDRHPRCIYGVASDMVRETPDMRSSHFDAEKWRVIAARLKKHVADAVDTVKQVAVKAAQSMSAETRKRSKKQWKQNDSYQRNSYRSYGYREPALTPEELERKHWTQQLIQQAEDDLADMRDGYYPALRYIADRVKKTPEQYDQILQDAIEKYKDYVEPDPMDAYEQDANGHWWLKKDYKSHVPNVRLMSSEDEPKTLGNILGAASV